MTLRRELRWTILIQGSGAIASLATVVLLGLLAGPAVQGDFSRLKSALELLMAIAMLGAPQALLYFLRIRKVAQQQITNIILATGLLGVACATLYALIQNQTSFLTLLLLAGATAAGTIHGVLRGAILASRPSGIFNAVTAIPQILLLPVALMAGSCTSHSDTSAALPFFLTWLCSMAIAIFFSRGVAPLQVANPVRLPQLMNFSGASWLTTVLMSGAPALWLQYVNTTSGLIVTGHFAMGMIGVQIFLTPVNYATPLLFKHWAGNNNISPISYSLRYGAGAMMVIIACTGIFNILPAYLSTSEYAPLFDVAGYFAIIAVLESMIRISYVASISNGQPWHTVITELTRISCLACTFILFTTTKLKDFATAWIIACFCTIAVSYLATWLLPPKSKT